MAHQAQPNGMHSTRRCWRPPIFKRERASRGHTDAAHSSSDPDLERPELLAEIRALVATRSVGAATAHRRECSGSLVRSASDGRRVLTCGPINVVHARGQEQRGVISSSEAGRAVRRAEVAGKRAYRAQPDRPTMSAWRSPAVSPRQRRGRRSSDRRRRCPGRRRTGQASDLW